MAEFPPVDVHIEFDLGFTSTLFHPSHRLLHTLQKDDQIGRPAVLPDGLRMGATELALQREL